MEEKEGEGREMWRKSAFNNFNMYLKGTHCQSGTHLKMTQGGPYVLTLNSPKGSKLEVKAKL